MGRPRLRAALLLLLGLFCTVALIVAFPKAAYADLTIYVGYPGGPYYEKATYTDEEIEAMSSNIVYEYTCFDSMPALRKAFARGIELRELFLTAGIDVESLWRFYFCTEDRYIADDGGYGNDAWYYDALVNTPRYYFSNLCNAVAWDYDANNNGRMSGNTLEQITDSMDMDLAWDGAVEVPTILAYESSFERIIRQGDINTYWNDDAYMTGNNKYRLLFGQTDPTASGARDSAHSIRSITCIFPNTPTIEFSLPQSEFQIGDSFTFTPALYGLDEEINTNGIKDIEWTTSDSSIAQIERNADGSVTVTMVGEGEFSITASFGYSSYKEFVATKTVSSSGAGGGTGGGIGQGQGASEGDDEISGGAEQSNSADTAEETADEIPEQTTISPEMELDASSIDFTQATTTSTYKLNQSIGGGGQNGLAESGMGMTVISRMVGVGIASFLLLVLGVVLSMLSYEKNRDKNVTLKRSALENKTNPVEQIFRKVSAWMHLTRQ